MSCQGYGSLLSSPNSILFRQSHSQSGSSLLPSEKGTSFFDGPFLLFYWDLTRRDLSFRVFVCLFVFARVSWLSIPKILSWALQPDSNALRADSEARVLFKTSAIL